VSYAKELEFARKVARRAGELALKFQSEGVEAEAKSDLSPVTAADRASERLIVSAIEQEFPEDGLLGEEGSDRPGRSGRKWIIDPIDGTREYVRGNPAWSNLIALEEGGESRVGVAHFPATGRTYWAVKDGGAFRDETRLQVSSISEPGSAVLCINGMSEVAGCAFAPRLLDWLAGFWAVRAFGGCLDAVLVAEGKVDAWLEPSAKPWDFAALRLIGEEAGAVFFNFDGDRSNYGGDGVLCTPGLEAELRRFVSA
jgi:histidinol phosphatase-like enzyme (inositol monophosphatase family)